MKDHKWGKAKAGTGSIVIQKCKSPAIGLGRWRGVLFWEGPSSRRKSGLLLSQLFCDDL
jgi:hypothetical protein